MITAQRLVRALDKGLSSCHDDFEGPKGEITKGIAPTVSYPCFNDCSTEAKQKSH